MLSINAILIGLALLFCILSVAFGRVPLWIAVLLVILERLVSLVGVR